MIGQKSLQVSDRTIETYSDHLESLVVKLLKSGRDLRNFGHAGTTPGRPKIDQNHLA